MGKTNIDFVAGEAVAVREKPLAVIPDSLVDRYCDNLWRDATKMDYLFGRGLSPAVITEYQIGHTGVAYVIPYHDDGKCTGLKFRRDDDVSKDGPKYWNLGGTTTRWYPWEPTGEYDGPVWVTEGELDSLLLWSLDIPAFTLTTGAGSLPVKLLTEMESYPPLVRVAYDQDERGQQGAKRLIGRIKKRTEVELINWPLSEGKDLTERYQKIGRKQFREWLSSFAP